LDLLAGPIALRQSQRVGGTLVKVTFVSVENDITAIGFRRMAALARSIHDDVDVCYVVQTRVVAPLRRLLRPMFPESPQAPGLDADAVAAALPRSDLVCLSSMSTHASSCKRLIQAIRRTNPRAFVLWGGIHCIVHPEDAIRHADAVCTGEGERPFEEFLRLLREGRDPTSVRSMWFRTRGAIVRNPMFPLLTNEELERRPFPLCADREVIHVPGRGFVPLRPMDYVDHEGLSYNALWSLGCPNRCTYCGNSRFLKVDSGYGRLRHPSVRYLVREVNEARRRLPHLSSVTFHDDSLMALPRDVLEELAARWRRDVGLPFAVHGLVARHVSAEKMRPLVAAGMMRVRMGVQSGSPRTLRFYRRPDGVEAIRRAATVINAFQPHMMAPSYDVITENPVETRDDLRATLRLLRELPRPYVLNLFPLMAIDGTELAQIARDRKLELPPIGPPRMGPTLYNVLAMALALVRLPDGVLRATIERAADPAERKSRYVPAVRLLGSLVVLKRAWAHARHGNVSVFPGRAAWVLWKLGVVSALNARMLRRCAAAAVTAPRPSAGAASRSSGASG
jgi:radical SAM superfamily enzyme YgiQ (UPF0313 family)